MGAAVYAAPVPSPRRALAAALVAVVVATAGCSGGAEDDGGTATTAPAATPTAPGDRPRVEVVEPGSGERRVLALDLAGAPSPTSSSLTVSQQVVRDASPPAVVPPITAGFETALAPAADGETTATRTWAQPTVDATGVGAADVRDVRAALRGLAGAESTLTVRPDGTASAAESGNDAAARLDAQLRDLVPVLPAEPVGPGASWTATSVVDVDGAVVDQVATYTLESLDGDAYVVAVTVEQSYRPGEVEGVEVRSGGGTVTARLEGSLRSLLPERATGTVSTQVSYVVQQRVVEVRTTVTLGLTAG